jgi:exopolyphosphatase/guanosine-5'-triphosphate,3'-diphosphate pyrophosphatase
MHARIDPAVEAVKLRKGQRIEIEVGRYLMNAHPTLAYWLAREQSAWEEAGVPFVVRNVS